MNLVFKDVTIRDSIKLAVRRGHNKILPSDLKTIYRKSKGSVSIIYGLDASGSMKGQKLGTAKKAGVDIRTDAEVDRLMHETDPSLVSLLIDTGHIGYGGGDAVEQIKKHSARIKNVHLKDIREPIHRKVQPEGWSFLESIRQGAITVPGDGCIDFDPIFAALADIHYEGWFIVEADQDPAKANPLTYAKMGREFIRQKTGL